jgi:hypothetical protein
MYICLMSIIRQFVLKDNENVLFDMRIRLIRQSVYRLRDLVLFLISDSYEH